MDFLAIITLLLEVALLVAIPVLVLLVLRALIAGGVRAGVSAARGEEEPLVILQRRYARGEIDEAEFERRRAVLRG